jgi:hypothetical protein
MAHPAVPMCFPLAFTFREAVKGRKSGQKGQGFSSLDMAHLILFADAVGQDFDCFSEMAVTELLLAARVNADACSPFANDALAE